jgi:plastocyanin
MGVRRTAVAWAAALVVSCGLLALPLVAFGATSAVTIQNSTFSPPSITIRAGDVVRWTNADPFSHTATSNSGAWDTGVIAAGGSSSITFANAGTFPYHCAIHAFMTGTVVVMATNTPAPTPPPTAPPTASPPPPSTPLPTPVRTAPPTAAPTARPTAPPTNLPTAAPTESAAASPTSSATASPTSAAVETLTVSASPSPVAVQLTPGPEGSGPGPAPLLIGAAALAVAGLGAVAFLLARARN